MPSVTIVGRSSSLFTRVPRVFAHQAGVAVELSVVRDLAAQEADAYGGNPALKIPTLRRSDGGLVFGAANVTRVILDGTALRVAWPEDVRSDRGRNAHEMLAHAMSAQVQMIMGTVIGALDATVFAKVRRGLEGALGWLDANADAVLAEIAELGRDASWFAHALGCTVEHFAFRPTIDIAPYRALARFAEGWARGEAARATAYRFD